jgi:hypothetical protein
VTREYPQARRQARFSGSAGLALSAGAALFVATSLVLTAPAPAFAAKQHRVDIAYIAPKDPQHRPIYETLKNRRVLEQFKEILSPYSLPHKLTLKLQGCDGTENAWYDDEDYSVTVCYEYLARVARDAPRETTAAGVTPEDALVGPTAEVFLHEFAHALFDLLRIPVLGREEDAADMVAAYTLLQLGPKFARSAIGGVAYMYNMQANDKPLTAALAAEEHPLMQQRFFNLLCLAYGADPKNFGDVVEKGYLPKARAENCEIEYAQTDYAMRTLLQPHMNKTQAKKVRTRLTRKLSGSGAKPSPK